MLDDFTEAPVFKAHLYNGAHADSLGPQSLAAATELLDVYVAERVPQIDPVVRFGAPALYEAVFGVSGIELPPDRFASMRLERRWKVNRRSPCFSKTVRTRLRSVRPYRRGQCHSSNGHRVLPMR